VDFNRQSKIRKASLF